MTYIEKPDRIEVKKGDKVVSTHGVPYGTVHRDRRLIPVGTKGVVTSTDVEPDRHGDPRYLVEFEGYDDSVNVYDDEIELANPPQVLSEDVEETLVIERTDSTGNWSPWSLETDGVEAARENMARDDAIDADAHDFHGVAERHEFRLVKITKTTKREVL